MELIRRYSFVLVVSLVWAKAGVAAGAAEFQQPGPASSLSEPVPKQESAEVQLLLATDAHQAARGRKGPRRQQLLHEAIEYYQAVGRWWPGESSEVSVAAFRRGEIHRSLDEAGRARGAFEEVIESASPSSDLHIRAILEVGHIDRRDRRWSDAARHYRRAAACEEASLRFRNDAREWLLKVHLQTMSWGSAEQTARQWLKDCEGPAEEVQVTDYLIRALIGARQLRLARTRLQELHARMEVLSEAPTKEGSRVKRALGQMKAPAALVLARQNGR